MASSLVIQGGHHGQFIAAHQQPSCTPTDPPCHHSSVNPTPNPSALDLRRTPPVPRVGAHACAVQDPLFAGLSHDELVDIDEHMISLSWAQGDPLYTAGGRAEHLFVLAVGWAKVSRPTPDGKNVVVDLLAPGDLFGGLQALGQSTYPETVEAMSTTCALRIDTPAFRDVLEQHPQVALRVLDDTSALLAHAAPI